MKVALEYGDKYNIKDNVKYAVRGITKIVQKIGPRAPGSPEELRAQEWMARDLKNYCENVNIEEFTVHRQAFMGFIPFTVACAIAAVITYWFASALASLILVILGFIPLIFEFVMYKRFIDKLFKGHTSHNVEAVRKPVGEVKKRIIFVGHSDSQYEWTLNYLFGGNGMKAVLIPAVVGLVVQLAASVVALIMNGIAPVKSADSTFLKVMMIVISIFVPFQLAFLLFQSFTRSVPGANDNLSGCFTGIAAIKAMDEAEVRFENTEVVMVCSGSEEAGLRGSKAYNELHYDELHNENIETCVIALDTFRDLSDMAIYDRDLSGTVQHDLATKEMLKEAAANCGFDLKYESVYIGGSDAASFTQKGVKATCLCAMDPTPPKYYHTRLDDVNMLVPDAIEAGINICIETACLFDKRGLTK